MTSTTRPSSGLLRSACRFLFAHPVVRWFRTRSRRRGLVLGFGAMLAGTPALTSLVDEDWPAVIMFVPLMIGVFVLAGVTDGLFDRPLHALDERQRRLRQTVFDNPYMTGAGFGIAAGAVASASFGSDHPVTMSWALVAVMATFLLPTLVLAWRLPDAVDDGE